MFIDCGQETELGLDLNCAGKWLGWLNQGAYPEAKVVLTQQVFTCTCVCWRYFTVFTLIICFRMVFHLLFVQT